MSTPTKILIKAIVDDYGAPLSVTLVANDDDKDYSLRIKHEEIGEHILVSDYTNAVLLSADLRDNIGFGPAKELLERNNVPRSHPLWDLNHSGLWER